MPAGQVALTSLNSPRWLGLQLVAYDSAYRTALEAKGFPKSARYDVSLYIQNIELRESAGEAAMQLSVTLEDPSRRTVRHKLQALTVGSVFRFYGPAANYYVGGSLRAHQLLFLGRTWAADVTTDAKSKTRSYTVYDNASYLARHEGVEVYLDKTFTEIVADVARKYGYSTWIMTDTKVKVGKIVMGSGWTFWDLFKEAAARTFEKTGRAYHVRSDPAKKGLDLLEFGRTGFTWAVGDGPQGSLLSHTYTDSAEDLATRVLVIQEEYDEEGEFKANRRLHQGLVMGDLRDTFGDILKIQNPDASLTYAYNPDDHEWAQITKAIREQVKQQLKNLGRTKQKATLHSLYIPGIRVGDRINAGTTVGSSADPVQNNWIVDSVRTTWEPTGPSQDIDIVRSAADSAMGFVR